MGLPLLDWIFTREETTESECAVLVKQVMQGLQYLHSSQVAYLDLKVCIVFPAHDESVAAGVEVER